MASSGSKSITVTSWDTLKFSWWENSQSIDNNTTTIGWKMELIATSSGRIDSSASKSWSVTVNGTTYSGTNKIGISNNATKTLASGTTTIAHNSDGTKIFSYSFSQQFSITFSGSSIGTKSGSGSGTLDTIPRTSTLSVKDGTLGTAQILTVTRQLTSFTHTITYKCGSDSGTICTKSTDTSISFTPPLSLASQNPNGESVSITYTITTYNGSTNIGSNPYTKTCSIPASVKPTVSLTVTDEMDHLNTFGGYVQGISKFRVVVTASGSYGSTIKSYKTIADGKSYTSASFTSGVISGKGILTISTTVTDSRGRPATASVDVTVLAYSSPQISSLRCFRCDAEGAANSTGEYLAIVFDSDISALNNKNFAIYQIQYKKVTDKEYTTETMPEFAGQYSVSGGVFVLSADKSSSYNITLIATDSFTNTKRSGTGASIKKRFSILKKAFGFAIGKIAELENVFDIALQTRFLGGILHPVLEPDTDLNEILTPNTYIGANLSSHKYTCGGEALPLTTGTFALEVVGMGAEGQLKQRLTYCHKKASRAWERIYHKTNDVMSWGDWICVSDYDGQLLWDGSVSTDSNGWYMIASQTATLAEPVSKQRSGIVLVFSEIIDDAGVDQSFHTRFVPKKVVESHNGKAECIQMTTSNLAYFATKYLYIYDNKITGHDNNILVGTGACGIAYTNNRFVLRYVIGV